jgi:hypothetical protein
MGVTSDAQPFSPVAGEEVRKSIERRILLLNHTWTKQNGHNNLIIGGCHS